LNNWQSKFADKIHFVVVYISEAHANDVWPLGKHVDIKSHKTFEERVAASDILTSKYGLKIPVVYDTMANEFDKHYAVWPERYYIIQQAGAEPVLDWIFYPNVEVGYNRQEIEDCLLAINEGRETPTIDFSYTATLPVEEVLRIMDLRDHL